MKYSEKLHTHMEIEKLRELLSISDAMSSIVEMGIITIDTQTGSIDSMREQSEFLNGLVKRALFLVHSTRTTAVAAIRLAEELASK